MMAAVNKVERRDYFKIDIADIERLNNRSTLSDISNECVWNNDTKVLQHKSTNGITAPDIDSEEFISTLPTWQLSKYLFFVYVDIICS